MARSTPGRIRVMSAAGIGITPDVPGALSRTSAPEHNAVTCIVRATASAARLYRVSPALRRSPDDRAEAR